MKPVIGITVGDINGIGTEIAFKAVSENAYSNSRPVLIVPESVAGFYAKQVESNPINSLKEAEDEILNILSFDSDDILPKPGSLTPESGKAAMGSIERAIQLCLDKSIDAMVTLPISKEAINLAGYNIPGHTEFLAEKTGTEEVLMMLVNDSLRVSLVTNHHPISKVATLISKDLIIRKANILFQSLKNDFGITNPNIAVFGLNPHAGDGGFIGREEIEIIKPALDYLNSNGVKAEGPFPADGFLGQKLHEQFDGILAMYHDQGLSPFKLLSFGSGVNFTAGLPIIRTSPDHGTGFDIAGKNKANPSSFIKAYQLAVHLAKKRSDS